MNFKDACGYLCCVGGAGLLIAAWCDLVKWGWGLAGVLLILLGWYLLRQSEPRDDAIHAVVVIEAGIDLLD